MFNELPRQLSLVDFSFDITFLDLESNLLKDFYVDFFFFCSIHTGKRNGEGRTCPDGTATLTKLSSKMIYIHM